MKSAIFSGWTVAAVATLGFATAPAMAQSPVNLTLQFLEVGSDIVGTASGKLNLSGGGLTSAGPGFVSGIVSESTGIKQVAIGGTTPTSAVKYTGLSLLSGSGSWVSPSVYGPASSGSGTGAGVLDISGSLTLFFDSTYVDGTSLSATSTWLNHTFSSRGLNTGTWVYGYGASGDTVTVQIGPSSGGTTGGGGGVPEPGEWAAMGILGAGLTGLVLRKRKKA